MQQDSSTNLITPNLYSTRDEVAIVDCLADHNEFPKSLEHNQVVSFFNGEDFHLVLYFANPTDRGFQMYVVRDFSIHVEEMCMLSSSFAQVIRDGSNIHQMAKAKNRVDDLIYMSDTLRAAFGKKLEEEL